ncbi:AAA family ATPase [Methylocaldum szegediense]|uniref:AAA family ATPase n=1 Tax=Methylocaldum szegediense TaxID=73780 RepID=UPI0004116ABF|nr:AAA family ATPase [Methylocaldum szegediense]
MKIDEEYSQNVPRYVETPTAKKIIDLLEYACYVPTIGVIYGGAGVGKTTTLKHYAENRPNDTWVVTAAQARRTTAAILAELVDSSGTGLFGFRTDSLFREAKAMIRRGLEWSNRKGLLIVDEAQHLETPAFDALRAFYDEVGIGIVYVGNEEVYSRIRGKKRSQLAQIYSRVSRRLPISAPTPEDVDAILEAQGITGREERAFCQMIGTSPGGLRSLNNVIILAKLLAKKSGSAIDVNILKVAATESGIFG